MTQIKRPKIGGEHEKALDQIEEQFESFDQQQKSLTMDKMRSAPREEVEPQTKLSQKDIARADAIYLKPVKSIGTQQKFNERFRGEYEFAKEYVHFIAENKEIIGDTIEMWTRPYGGIPAEFWQVPVNKPVWGPRYLAEQIKRKFYSRLVMDDSPNQRNYAGGDSMGTYYGNMTVEKTIERFTAMPVMNKKSIFMGASEYQQVPHVKR